MALAKASRLTVIILVIVGVALTITTIGAITINQNLSSGGTITAGPNLGVYSTSACTGSQMTSISWESVEAGGSASQTIYIEDTGATQMSPSITISNWSPSGVNTYISITWSTLPAEIQPGVSNAIAVTLTLTVSSSITGITTFSNSITISGTG